MDEGGRSYGPRTDKFHPRGNSTIPPPGSQLVIVPNTVSVEQRHLCDNVAQFVARYGKAFEEEVVRAQRSNPHFEFLTAPWNHPVSVYYRWRLYSLLQGDSLTNWRTDPFQIREHTKRWWVPPPMPNVPRTFLPGVPQALLQEQTAEPSAMVFDGVDKTETHVSKPNRASGSRGRSGSRRSGSGGSSRSDSSSSTGSSSSSSSSSAVSQISKVSSASLGQTSDGARSERGRGGKRHRREAATTLFSTARIDVVLQSKLMVAQLSTEPLPEAERAEFFDLLRKCSTPDREAIANAMVFCIDHCQHAFDILDCIVDSIDCPRLVKTLTTADTPQQVVADALSRTLARLFLLSDILNNVYSATSVGQGQPRAFVRATEFALPRFFSQLVSTIVLVLARGQNPQTAFLGETTAIAPQSPLWILIGWVRELWTMWKSKGLVPLALVQEIETAYNFFLAA
jgi:hypothetical protein